MIPSDEFAQRYLVDIARFYMDIEGPNSDVGGNFSHEDVMRQLFNSPLLDLLNADDVSQLLGLMIEKDLIVEHPDLFAGSFYEVKEGYLAQYDDERDRKKTVLWHCHNFGDEWAQKALAGIFSDADLDEEPGTQEKFDSNDASSKWDDAVWDESASPDQWEIPAADRTVTRSDNAAAIEEAAKSLDEVLGEFQDDHRLDNVLGEEKSVLVSSLKAGRGLLDHSTFNLRMAYLLTVDQLKSFIARYREKVMEGSIIQLATDAIKALVRALFDGTS